MPSVKSNEFLSGGSFSRVLSRGGEFAARWLHLSCNEGWGWRVESWFGSPLQGWRSPAPSWDFHFLVEFDLPLSLVGRSKNHSFSDSTSLGGCVHETSSRRTCLIEGIAALQQFPWGMCLSLWNPPAVLLLKKKIKLIFPQLQKACIPSEKLLLGYFWPL